MPIDSLAGLPANHEVQFYSDDSYLYDSVASYVADGVEAGEASIVVATGSHLRGIDALLEGRGFDIEGLRRSGHYQQLDALAVLPCILSDGQPDERKFNDIITPIICNASALNRPVRVFGELVTLLAIDSNHSGALELERFWNTLQRNLPFTLFCAYSMASLQADTTGEFLSRIVAEHSRVIPAEGYSVLLSDFDRSREIVHLQQKAAWLETQIAERTKLEQQLQVALEAERQARQQAEDALAQREEFLSIAAHDLRTPITVLSGHAQLTLRQYERAPEIASEQVGPALKTIVGQADTLAVLVEQLLDISRLNAGKMSISVERIDLDQFVPNVVQHMTMSEPDRDIFVDSAGPLPADADPIRLEQVLVNLIDNALKFSPDSCPVEIKLYATSTERVEIAIRDYGDGVDENIRDQIFERYFQNGKNGKSEGLGLGLYIARQIVELHGGNLRGEYPDDGGSRFIVSLPAGDSQTRD